MGRITKAVSMGRGMHPGSLQHVLQLATDGELVSSSTLVDQLNSVSCEVLWSLDGWKGYTHVVRFDARAHGRASWYEFALISIEEDDHERP